MKKKKKENGGRYEHFLYSFYFLYCWIIYCVVFYMLFWIAALVVTAILLVKSVKGWVLDYMIAKSEKKKIEKNKRKILSHWCINLENLYLLWQNNFVWRKGVSYN